MLGFLTRRNSVCIEEVVQILRCQQVQGCLWCMQQ